jgi:hypothetical protein
MKFWFRITVKKLDDPHQKLATNMCPQKGDLDGSNICSRWDSPEKVICACSLRRVTWADDEKLWVRPGCEWVRVGGVINHAISCSFSCVSNASSCAGNPERMLFRSTANYNSILVTKVGRRRRNVLNHTKTTVKNHSLNYLKALSFDVVPKGSHGAKLFLRVYSEMNWMPTIIDFDRKLIPTIFSFPMTKIKFFRIFWILL